jgi:Domain of unknown function (DUF3303)
MKHQARNVIIYQRELSKGGLMKFMRTFLLSPEKRNEAIARFLKTGGQPPNGAKLLGRWTSADLSKGYDLLESDDPTAMAEFALQWSDLIKFEISLVVEDKDLVTVLKRGGF